ncbi:MAG: hypothetical protein ACRD2G_01955, partial [Terriglobia bacterium]
TTTITDPQNNERVYQFDDTYETERDIYQATSTLLKTVYTCYGSGGQAAPSPPCNGTALAPPFTQVAVTTRNDSNLESETVTNYNAHGLPTEVDEYSYGATPQGPYRKTLTSYATLSNANILDRPATIAVYSGSGGLAAQTSYSYDGNGNLTTLTENVTGSSTISRSFTYGTGGVLATATDFAGHTTTMTNGDCSGAFPTSVAQPLSLTSSMAWDCNTGLVTSVTDPNNQPTSFSYDDFYRLTQTNNPDGGQTSTAYNDAAPASVVTTTALGAPGSRVDTSQLDGLVRVTETQLNSDPAGAYKVDTTYNSLGRVASVSKSLPEFINGQRHLFLGRPWPCDERDPRGRQHCSADLWRAVGKMSHASHFSQYSLRVVILSTCASARGRISYKD